MTRVRNENVPVQPAFLPSLGEGVRKWEGGTGAPSQIVITKGEPIKNNPTQSMGTLHRPEY